ncbi:RNA 2'-phosphotransferase-like protein [mine drainage metagenome]|uniref:RNA 2'-phosphotransferase-like protein n=1 Tax=mine drainage metagenome TaxID=410659 RepID=T0YC89_9ZZZZ
MEEQDLRSCREDGAFRGEICPMCGDEGRGLMHPDEIEGISRILAGMLRHFPENYGVRMDPHGWVKIYTIVPAIRTQKRRYGWITPFHIIALATTDHRQRYQVNEKDEIRATYGHTITVDLSDLPDEDIPEIVYYQSTPEEYEFIMETGISPSDKTYVHLSSTYRKAYVSGLFHVDNPLILDVDTAKYVESGGRIMKASHEVYLSKQIPPEFLKKSDAEEIKLTSDEESDIKRVKQKRESRLKEQQD